MPITISFASQKGRRPTQDDLQVLVHLSCSLPVNLPRRKSKLLCPLAKLTPQQLLIALLVARWPNGKSAIEPTKYISSPDLRISLAPTILCLEMAVISIFHMFAYSSRDYGIHSKLYQQELAAGDMTPPEYYGGFLGYKAIYEALNTWDLVKNISRGFKWLFVGRRKRMLDISYAVSRIETDETMDEDPTAYSNMKLNPLNGSTTYTGAKSGSRPGKAAGYNLEEDQRPLVHGQPSPFFDASSGRDHSPYNLANTESREAGDIGGANSQFDEDDDWLRGRPGPAPPTIHIRAPIGQETNVPYPNKRSQQSRPIPYFDPPTSNGKKSRN